MKRFSIKRFKEWCDETNGPGYFEREYKNIPEEKSWPKLCDKQPINEDGTVTGINGMEYYCTDSWTDEYNC